MSDSDDSLSDGPVLPPVRWHPDSQTWDRLPNLNTVDLTILEKIRYIQAHIDRHAGLQLNTWHAGALIISTTHPDIESLTIRVDLDTATCWARVTKTWRCSAEISDCQTREQCVASVNAGLDMGLCLLHCLSDDT